MKGLLKKLDFIPKAVAEVLQMGKPCPQNSDIYLDTAKFLEDAGVMSQHDFESYGIVADDTMGEFFPERLDEIMAFCRKYPEFHIVSIMPDHTIRNTAVLSARWYYLADGDANPRIVVRDPPFMQALAVVRERARLSKIK